MISQKSGAILLAVIIFIYVFLICFKCILQRLLTKLNSLETSSECYNRKYSHASGGSLNTSIPEAIN